MTEDTLARFTIAPPLSIRLAAARVPRKTPRTLTLIMRSHASTDMSVSGMTSEIPALLTQPTRLPCRMATSPRASTEVSSVTSTCPACALCPSRRRRAAVSSRSEEHTSELQSRLHLVCRLLLEKKKKKITTIISQKNQTQVNHL